MKSKAEMHFIGGSTNHCHFGPNAVAYIKRKAAKTEIQNYLGVQHSESFLSLKRSIEPEHKRAWSPKSKSLQFFLGFHHAFCFFDCMENFTFFSQSAISPRVKSCDCN